MSLLAGNVTYAPTVPHPGPSFDIQDNLRYLVSGAAVLGFSALQYLRARKRNVCFLDVSRC